MYQFLTFLEQHFLCVNFVQAVVKQAIAIRISCPSSDIRNFMTGQGKIEAACYALAKRIEQIMSSSKKAIPKLLILPTCKQRYSRKLKMGPVNVLWLLTFAETSMTVNCILYVTDTSYCRIKVYKPRMDMDALQVFRVSHAAADQRAGRAGRTSPGACYRLYKVSAYCNEMLPSPIPEI